MVKAGHGGKDYRSRFGNLQHVREMDPVERRFAWYDDEGTAFLQAYVGRPVDEALGQPDGNCSQGAHRTRHDHHAGARKRAAGKRGREVGFFVCEDMRRKVLAQLHPGFEFIDEPARLRRHEVNDIALLRDGAQQLSGVTGAARAGDRDQQVLLFQFEYSALRFTSAFQSSPKSRAGGSRKECSRPGGNKSRPYGTAARLTAGQGFTGCCPNTLFDHKYHTRRFLAGREIFITVPPAKFLSRVERREKLLVNPVLRTYT